MRVVLITAPPGDAPRIAETLVRERLVACVNIVPAVASIYRWKGKIERDTESLLVAKTCPACVSALVRRVKAVHPYDVPEVVCLPIREGNADYLAWIGRSCGT